MSYPIERAIPITDQVPTFRPEPQTQLGREEISAMVQTYAERYPTLSPILQQIAIDVAIDALLIPERDLIRAAGRLDADIENDAVAHFDFSTDGRLTEVFFRQRREELQLGKGMNEADDLAFHFLRLGIASRTARVKLAREMGMRDSYAPNEEFNTANDLTSNAVSELRARIYH